MPVGEERAREPAKLQGCGGVGVWGEKTYMYIYDFLTRSTHKNMHLARKKKVCKSPPHPHNTPRSR